MQIVLLQAGQADENAGWRRYLSLRQRLLPQLLEDADGGPVHVSILEARLSTSLANSAFTPAALLFWQCYGSAHPLRSGCLGILDRSVRARPLLRRHERLAHTHWVLLKVGGCWLPNLYLHPLEELESTKERQLHCVFCYVLAGSSCRRPSGPLGSS